MIDLVILISVFIAVGIGFLLTNLAIGRLVRPNLPETEKGEIYECGEPAVGSSWIQFDLRFYVVALLFVIFDVEMAFFFPWASVFGGANKLADENIPIVERVAIQESLAPGSTTLPDPVAAHELAKIAFLDLLFFFGVLLVGFAYLWKRGDLEWVRSTVAQAVPPPDSTRDS